MITIEKTGRRYYIIGNTYQIKDALKASGCRWDPEKKAWWTGKKDVADKFDGATSHPQDQESDQESQDQVVCGRVRYKGRTYYAAGKVLRGSTRWDRDRVEPIVSASGKVLLLFQDGSQKFWAERTAVEMLKRYQSPKTISGLREYAERSKSGEARCAECGGFGRLIQDLEDGLMKHARCCDIPSE